MLKVVVFDSGWGGELFADYVEEEVPILEVIREIDWRNAPYSARSEEEIFTLTETAVRKYIGRVDVIVIAAYLMTAVTLEKLRRKYPEQKFLGFNLRLSKNVGRKVIILAPAALVRTKSFAELSKSSVEQEICWAPCDGWEQLIDDGEMKQEILEETLSGVDKNSTVILGSTHYQDVKVELERIFGWQGSVVDDFRRMLTEVCMALKLRGLDGRRRK